MKKTAFIIVLIFPLLPLMAQRKTRERKPTELWWTMYGGVQFLPGDIHITAKQPAIGYGGGHTFLFINENKEPKRLWMGFDFNQYYFGRKKINDYRVFYESWQLSFVTRFSFPSNSVVTPFIDLSAGPRLLVSLTSNNRRYGGLVFRRMIDMIARSGDGDGIDPDEYKIIREYDRFMLSGGMACGFLLGNKQTDKRLSLKGSINFGTASKFADYRNIISESDTYNYTPKRGSGRYYNIQLGYTFKF